MFSLLLGLAIIGALTALYFVPTFIALGRDHHQKIWIFVVNLLGGITGIAWLGALIWALLPARPRAGQHTGERNSGGGDAR